MSPTLLHTLLTQKRLMARYSKTYNDLRYAYIWHTHCSNNRSWLARRNMHDIRFHISALMDTRETMRIGFGS